MNRQGLLKSISDGEERLLFAKVLDQAMLAAKRRQPAFSDFMDRAKCARFAERLRGERELSVTAFGGTEDAERQKLGFCPAEEELTEEEFPISVLRITKKNKKFGQSGLSHRDYLGSILGLGIERRLLGDILVSEEETFCFVSEEIADYITVNLEQVSKTSVKVEQVSRAEAVTERQTETKRLTAASLRLDAVAGEVFHLSRGKVQALISQEKAAVNWSVVTSTSFQLKEGDMVSLRGFGRFRMGAVSGKTKKDRIVFEAEKYV